MSFQKAISGNTEKGKDFITTQKITTKYKSFSMAIHRKRGCKRMREQAQSSTEFLMLTGIVLIVFIPLFYYASGNIDIVRERKIVEGAEAVVNAARTLIGLGVGSQTTEIITVPSGITNYTVDSNILSILFKDSYLSFYFPIPINGAWPINEGTHRITLYNDGDYILFTECGNNIREAYEQCDGADSSACDIAGGEICLPKDNLDECKCTCTDDTDCQPGYVCNTIEGICEPTGSCPLGMDFKNGACCTDNDDDTYYLEGGVCSLEDCRDDDPTINPGVIENSDVICNDGIDNDCDGAIDCDDSDCQSLPLCTGPSCGNSVLEGTEECDGADDAACPGQCQLDCTCPSPSTCHNTIVDPGEECEGKCTADSECAAGTCNPDGVCTMDNVTIVDDCDVLLYQLESFSTIAGFNMPTGVVITNNGVYVGDRFNHRIRKIYGNALVATYAGTGVIGAGNGPALAATFNDPQGIDRDGRGTIFVADAGNSLIRAISPEGIVSTLAGSAQGFLDGSATTARFNRPSGVAYNPGKNMLYVADAFNRRVRQINLNLPPTNGFFVTTVVDLGSGLQRPRGVGTDSSGVYIADTDDHVIRKLHFSTNTVSILAGLSGSPGNVDGTGSSARFNAPWALDVDDTSTYLYIADRNNNKVRRLNLATNAVDSPTITGASFAWPTGISVSGSEMYVATASDTLAFGNPLQHYVWLIDLPSLSVQKIFGKPGAGTFVDDPDTGEKCTECFCGTTGGSGIGICGNGIVEGLEECDDGANGINTDQCTDLCTLTFCSDGFTQLPNGYGVTEECDDGNVVNGDGCDAACKIELIWSMSPNPGWPGKTIISILNNAVYNFIQIFYSLGGATSATVRICDDAGCNAAGNCAFSTVCSINVVASQKSCSSPAPPGLGIYPRYACLWDKSDLRYLTINSCGDGFCEPGETRTSCPSDCPLSNGCGDGFCDAAAGENCNSCTLDCMCLGGGWCDPFTNQCTNANGCNPSCAGVQCGPDPVCGLINCGICGQLEYCSGGTCVPIGAGPGCGDGIVQTSVGEQCDPPGTSWCDQEVLCAGPPPFVAFGCSVCTAGCTVQTFPPDCGGGNECTADSDCVGACEPDSPPGAYDCCLDGACACCGLATSRQRFGPGS